MQRQLPTRGIKREREDQEADAYPAEPSPPVMKPMDAVDLIRLSRDFRLLPVPEEMDDLEMTSRKMQDLARQVDEGNSLALYTGLKAAPQHRKNTESIAKANLTPYEWQQYDGWRKARASHDNGCPRNDNRGHMKLPAFNWDENKAPVPNGTQSLKKFRQRAEAMDEIWGHQGATPEHASWLTYHLTSMLPLVKAVTKIFNIERSLPTHSPKLTDMEAAELETARRVVAVAERNRSREMAKVRRLTRSITESVAIMKSRVQALEAKHGRSL